MISHLIKVASEISHAVKKMSGGTLCAHFAHMVEAGHHVAVFLHLAYDKA